MVVNDALRAKGAIFMKTRTVTATSFLNTTDYVVSVNNSAANVTINLPDPTTSINRVLIIKRYDITSTGTVSISTGLLTTVIEDDTGALVDTYTLGTTVTTRRVCFLSDGTNWQRIY
jgi:hypothetical protein